MTDMLKQTYSDRPLAFIAAGIALAIAVLTPVCLTQLTMVGVGQRLYIAVLGGALAAWTVTLLVAALAELRARVAGMPGRAGVEEPAIDLPMEAQAIV